MLTWCLPGCIYISRKWTKTDFSDNESVLKYPYKLVLSLYFRSIDSDHVVKGRRFDPRKPRFPRQQENVPPRHDARPRGADRERRVQSNKEKEATGKVNTLYVTGVGCMLKMVFNATVIIANSLFSFFCLSSIETKQSAVNRFLYCQYLPKYVQPLEMNKI